MKIVGGALFVAVLAVPGGESRGQESRKGTDVFVSEIRPLLTKYCLACHSGEKPKADVNLAPFADEASVLKSRKLWKKALDALHAREMPPEEKPQPSADERDRLTSWIETVLARPDASGRRDPGRPVLRRLNRTEYNNTVLDLFGFRRRASYFNPSKGMPEKVDYRPLTDSRRVLVDLPHDDVDYGFDNIGEVLTLPPFLLERYLAAATEIVEEALAEKTGAGLGRALRGSRAKTPEAAQTFLAGFVARAFRRPVAGAEVEPYFKLFSRAAAGGDSYENAMKPALQAVLVSPHFLFRVEGDVPSAGVRPVNDWELASRLSYFLWSTMPDEELLSAARKGTLRDPAALEQQVRRMLRDPKAKELGETFGLQWLQLAGVEAAMPDPMVFKTFYATQHLPRLMRQETLLLFETILAEDRSILEFIDANWTWANGQLRQYYGLGEAGAAANRERGGWTRVQLPDKRRGGILTLGAVLTVTSLPTRTSPVKRGKWVLEAVLGTPPPPPPPKVPELEEDGPRVDGLTLRKRLEQHRSNPNCASCHNRIDPIGFALENYDAVGFWRDKDGKNAVDTATKLTDGTSFRGIEEFKRVLVSARRDDFARCLAEHLLTFALGRKLEYTDAPAVKEIVQAVAKDGYRFSRLVVEVARSYPFLHRRTGEVKE